MNINDLPVGYGHLDKENDRVWLGICVVEMKRGHGIGKVLMKFLLDEAERQKISTVYLSVDRNNTAAINLYQKYGFYLRESMDNIFIFGRTF